MENVDYVIANIKNEKESVRKEIQTLHLELADLDREIELCKLRLRDAESARAQKKQVKDDIVAHIDSCTEQFAKIKSQTQQLVQSTHKRQMALSNFKLTDKPETPSLENGGRGSTSKGSRGLAHAPSKLEKVDSYDEKIDKNEKSEKSEKSEKLLKSSSELNTGTRVVPSASKSDLTSEETTTSTPSPTKGKKQRQKKDTSTKEP